MSATDKAFRLKYQHRTTWRGESESYWFARLVEEVGELGGALVGNHNDTPDHELSQIAAIALNWLEMRAPNTGDYTRARGVIPLDDTAGTARGSIPVTSTPAEEGEPRIICDVCEESVVQDEHFTCPTCEVQMCLYCWQSEPCPEHGGDLAVPVPAPASAAKGGG